jgi:hypothetical protein
MNLSRPFLFQDSLASHAVAKCGGWTKLNLWEFRVFREN